jgi:hypothetical protein
MMGQPHARVILTPAVTEEGLYEVENISLASIGIP